MKQNLIHIFENTNRNITIQYGFLDEDPQRIQVSTIEIHPDDLEIIASELQHIYDKGDS